jgi:hypothetical protein
MSNAKEGKLIFNTYQEAFNYLVGLRRNIVLGTDHILDVTASRDSSTNGFKRVGIKYLTPDGVQEFLLEGPEYDRPGLFFERFSPTKTIRSLTGQSYRYSIGEPRIVDYYYDFDRVPSVQGEEEMQQLKADRQRDGLKLAEKVKELIDK